MSSDDEYWAERRREEERAYKAMREIEIEAEEVERYGPRPDPFAFRLPVGFLIYGGAAFLLSLLVECLLRN